MKNWDYSDLSKKAKTYGGPEEMLQAIEDEGIQKGREEMEPEVSKAKIEGFVEGGALAFVLWKGIDFFHNRINGYRERKRLEREAAERIKENGEEAKRQMLQMMNTEAENTNVENKEDD